jgi:hypothetical protein
MQFPSLTGAHFEPKNIATLSLAPAAPACNSMYAGGRDQEDQSSKPAQANTVGETLKNPSQK